MKLDTIIQKILPHDEKFYALLGESTQNLVSAAELMKKLAVSKTTAEREKLVTQITVLEHHGDNLTHKIFSELNATFVTPFDREDIHHLASSLDDVMDHIDGSASKVTLYKLKKCPPAMVKLTDILQLSIGELHRGVGLLRDLNRSDELQKVFHKVNEYENEADEVFGKTIAKLFEKEKDPIQIIKLKEIYMGLETATDKCEDAANVLEGIFIKHS